MENIEEFEMKLIEESEDLDPLYSKVVDNHFWELFDTKEISRLESLKISNNILKETEKEILSDHVHYTGNN